MGLSTSALVKRMISSAEDEGFECSVAAFPVAEAEKEASDADAILIGPQVSYQAEKVKALLPDIPVEVIPMQDYGMMNGKNVLAQAKRMMGI